MLPRLEHNVRCGECAYSCCFVRMASKDSVQMMKRVEEGKFVIWDSWRKLGNSSHKPTWKSVDGTIRVVGQFHRGRRPSRCQGGGGQPRVRSQVEVCPPEGPPRNMARAERFAGRVTSPPKLFEFAKVEADIRKWEDHQRTLAKDIRELFSETVKMGILLQMLPKHAHSFVFQTLGNEVKCEQIGACQDICGSQGRQDGRVWSCCCHAEWGGEEYLEAEDLGAASMNTSCRGSQGWEHVCRDCPTVAAKQEGLPKGKEGARER